MLRLFEAQCMRLTGSTASAASKRRRGVQRGCAGALAARSQGGSEPLKFAVDAAAVHRLRPSLRMCRAKPFHHEAWRCRGEAFKPRPCSPMSLGEHKTPTEQTGSTISPLEALGLKLSTSPASLSAPGLAQFGQKRLGGGGGFGQLLKFHVETHPEKGQTHLSKKPRKRFCFQRKPRRGSPCRFFKHCATLRSAFGQACPVKISAMESGDSLFAPQLCRVSLVFPLAEGFPTSAKLSEGRKVRPLRDLNCRWSCKPVVLVGFSEPQTH